VASIGRQRMGGGTTTFEWGEGRAFLVQHAYGDTGGDTDPGWAAASPLPLVTVTGLDDASGALHMLYADARGVCRVYEMSLADGVWRMWRDAPGFFQRFTGTFSADGDTVTGAWEGSPDGVTWQHDFDVTYTRT